MIAASPCVPVAYLWEPFSPLHRPGICAARFPYWFPYVSIENEEPVLSAVRDMLELRYRPRAEIGSLRQPRDAARMARDWARFARWRRVGAVPLMKDPTAVFSAEWLCDTFGMHPVVLVRHPAAFVHSLVKRHLTHPFDHFLRQPLLMRDLLSDYEDEVQSFARRERPVFDQAVLLWKLIHSAICEFRQRRPGWRFLRLEDVALDPVGSFQDLYGWLGLPFDESVRRMVVAHSDASNPAEVADPSATKRNSRASVAVWRQGLSPEEVATVRAGVEPLATAFYGDDDW